MNQKEMKMNRQNSSVARESEWFVPRFGSTRFKTFIGLLFLPYTGMVLAFSLIGSMLSRTVLWDRVLAIVVIYFLGLGIGAHALDALGSRQIKPWGSVFTRQQLWLMAILSLAIAYGIAIYYMIFYVPLLWSMAILEGFFVFAYNLEWYHGKFHTDGWFAFSWGFMPVLSGYIIQTNRVSLESLLVAGAMSLFGLIEIKASRPYRDLKQRMKNLQEQEAWLMKRYETILKSISIGVMLLGGGLAIWRLQG